MAQRSRYNFWIDLELRKGLTAIYERDGILPSEQIRRAIQAWLEKKGVRLRPPGLAKREPKRN